MDAATSQEVHTVNDDVEKAEKDIDQAASLDAENNHRASARARVIRFVASFVLLVFVFLAGYRYALDTRANVWYLFQVARHTAAVLALVGDEAELEPGRTDPRGEKREKLALWLDGIDADEPAVEPDELTPYEAWQFKAFRRMDEGGTIANEGPLIRFVQKEGTGAQRAQLTRIIRQTERDPSLTQEQREATTEELKAELSALDTTLEGIEDDARRNQAQRGNLFSFRVVPDCGAIPSMSIYLAAVLAFPTLLWKRAVGAAAGVFVLYWINIGRLATLSYIGAVDRTQGQKWFNFFHEYIWQGIFIVFVVIVWMVWVEVIVRFRRT